MTAEQIRSSITFTIKDARFGAQEVVGTFTIHSSVKIDPNCPDCGIEEAAKNAICENILKALYDDQRMEINKALMEVLEKTPMGYSPGCGEAIEALLKAARFQRPT